MKPAKRIKLTKEMLAAIKKLNNRCVNCKRRQADWYVWNKPEREGETSTMFKLCDACAA